MSAVISSVAPLHLGLRIFNRVGLGLNSLGLGHVTLDADHLLYRAQKKTGLSDFGPTSNWREGLERLIASYEQEARFTVLGRLGIRAFLDRVLEQRLMLFEVLRQHPEIHAKLGLTV
jgi:hypothetical protein